MPDPFDFCPGICNYVSRYQLWLRNTLLELKIFLRRQLLRPLWEFHDLYSIESQHLEVPIVMKIHIFRALTLTWNPMYLDF